MPDILHRLTVDAPPASVHELIATADGVERWWTGHPNSRDGATLAVFFRDEHPAAVVTTLLFTHAEWPEGNEFMAGCSTNWGAYLASLKAGAEKGEFAAFPAGELSRWS